MDSFLIVTGAILVIAGILGSVLPVLPGPPISYLGIMLLHFTEKYQFSGRFLIVWAVITILVIILDYVIPAWGTKKFGGSKRGIYGSLIGLALGVFFLPPIGIIIGPFAGAVIGEMTAGKQSSEALRSGFGSFVGFIIGTILKLTVSGLMAWYYFKELIVA